jgi:hypothetical protein
MCGLCGVLGGGADWADGLSAGETGAASAVASSRRTARREQVAIANAVLRRAGLTMSDWQGSAFVLRRRTGSTEMVGSLGELWTQADRLGTSVDPLDPDLLEDLDERRRG